MAEAAGHIRSSRFALPALLLGATAIGLAPIFVRISELGPTATAFHRMFLSLPVLAIGLAFARRTSAASSGRLDRRALFLMLAAGAFFAGDLASWHRSILITSVANATLLTNVTPIFVVLVGWWFFGERVGLRFMVGVALAIGGAALLIGKDLQLSTAHFYGDALALIAAVFYSGYLITISRARSSHTTIIVMLVSGVACSALLLPLTLLSGENLVPATAQGWAILIGLAVISHAGGQGLIAYALAHLPASFGSVALLWQPVAAAVFAWLLLSEPLSAWQIVGGAIVLAGIALSRSAQRKSEI